jgi:hemerythrin-like domain-containing protein
MNPRSQLADDHSSLEALLREIEAALRDRDIHAISSKLDLFWARLAVHIRAEHLHLFPAVLGALKNDAAISVAGLSLTDAEFVVDSLRSDHDFFMRELASAVALVREQRSKQLSQTLTMIRNKMLGVESRLKRHNEIEESQIYPLAIETLSEQRQFELAGQIRRELMKRPKRFTEENWRSET